MENVEVIKTTVGNIIENYSEKAKNDLNVTTVYTVSNKFGLLPSIDYWKKKGSKNKKSYKMFSNDTSNYNIVRKNMFAYNPSCLNIGSIDCLLNKEAGLVSPMYKIFKIKENIILPKYLLHFLKSKAIINKIDSLKEKGARNRFDFEKWEKIEINIPPLKKQEQIVAVLDKFTELTEELTAREAQYDYYRNMFLNQEWIEKEEGKEVEWKALEEVCKILNSKRKPITRKNRIEGIYPYYGANGIKSFVKDYIFNEVLILMGEDGSVMNKNKNPVLHWIENQKIWVNNHAHVLGQLNKKYNLKYIYYFLSTIDVSKIVKGLPPKLNQSNLRKIQIPIPSLKTQQKIIDILDKFEALVNDISQGLPREIELRQKQYEYYREKLLTF